MKLSEFISLTYVIGDQTSKINNWFFAYLFLNESFLFTCNKKNDFALYQQA